MDSFELNKILGAILGTCLAVLSLNIASGAIFAPKKAEKPGYEIAVQEPAGGAGGAPAAPAAQDEPLPKRLASADAGRGEASAKKCATCHTFGKGEPNRVGPNLYGVIGRARASVAGFNYSAAMKAKGGEWSFDDIDHFIASPKAFVPGTSMGFAGIGRGSERADILMFLRTKADSPPALPQAAEATPAAGADQPKAQ